MPRQAEEVLEYDDFLGWTVSSLKDFLSLRGLKQTGRKSELIARAFGAYELNVPVKFSQEQIYQQIKDEYSRRLTKNEIKVVHTGQIRPKRAHFNKPNESCLNS